MSKFKVGDRVKVVSEVEGMRCRGRSYTGECGEVVCICEEDENDLKLLMDDGDTWWFGADELDLASAPSTPHYTPDSTGKDYLARCEDTFSREEMIGAYRFTLGKYVDRMGKKTGEPVEKELAKIIDYATRAKAWLERS